METVEKFQQLKPNLDELFKLWREFENAATKVLQPRMILFLKVLFETRNRIICEKVDFQIEGRITRSEREKRSLFDENDRELLRRCERIVDDIGKVGNDQAQQLVNNRLSEFRRRISAIKRVYF